ncbi:unnamed protein product [Polarella glacialis]|uniref:Alpha-glucosidase n=1 Tax=Polarella glacialis TaxID=89957 RepID=A0A813GKZ4_POLGL|nr:unnamed protein product [Polarella glacialis]
MPASSLAEGTSAYYSLIGTPRVPPRFAFGFIASRWGWESPAYIEQILGSFRSGNFPLDAVIFDFEWFTNVSDYDLLPAGEPWYQDFDFQKKLLPDPRAQLEKYQERYNVRVGGIRKPRLGNSQVLKDLTQKGWMLPQGCQDGTWPPLDRTYADGRNMNFSMPEVRDWYAGKLEGMLRTAPMAFWWNDEGEVDFFTFHRWNEAERKALATVKPRSRFWSLNRAFSPGMARLGATLWTGDVNPTWEDLYKTPGMMLNWALAGAPYVACDSGGFTGATNAQLLTRWLQVATFMPTMRVHSQNGQVPHFPFLWGDQAANAMRCTLNVRYRLLPYHYSLAHRMFQTRQLWVRPLAMDFPNDKLAASLTTQWLDGDILVAPILAQVSNYSAYLPEGLWFTLSWEDGEPLVIHKGPTHVTGEAAFDEVPAFVRAGTILPLAPVLQHTGALPGGALEVQVFGGADGSFELVEDDGESVDYEAGHTCTTLLTWDDASRVLQWSQKGLEPDKHSFTHLYVTYFGPGVHRSVPTTSKTVALRSDQKIILADGVATYGGDLAI